MASSWGVLATAELGPHPQAGRDASQDPRVPEAGRKWAPGSRASPGPPAVGHQVADGPGRSPGNSQSWWPPAPIPPAQLWPLWGRGQDLVGQGRAPSAQLSPGSHRRPKAPWLSGHKTVFLLQNHIRPGGSLLAGDSAGRTPGDRWRGRPQVASALRVHVPTHRFKRRTPRLREATTTVDSQGAQGGPRVRLTGTGSVSPKCHLGSKRVELAFRRRLALSAVPLFTLPCPNPLRRLRGRGGVGAGSPQPGQEAAQRG